MDQIRKLFTLKVSLPFTMGTTQENMAVLLAKRDARIRDLEIENMELKSKLDKYQMIFTGKDIDLTRISISSIRLFIT